MQTVFGLFSLESAEAAVADMEQRLGTDAVNLLLQESAKERLTTGRAQPAAPGRGQSAQVEAPTLSHLLSRKRAVFLAETGSIFAIHDEAARILGMATSHAPTKIVGSLKVALEEYGVSTAFANAYATGVQHGYVLVFAHVPENQILEISERLESHGGREVFTFQRLD